MGQVETGSGRSNSPLPKGLLGLLYDKMVPEVQFKTHICYQCMYLQWKVIIPKISLILVIMFTKSCFGLGLNQLVCQNILESLELSVFGQLVSLR